MIAEEAGGLITGSHDVFAATAPTDQFGDVTEEILTGRKYVVVRAIGGNPVRVTFFTISRCFTYFWWVSYRGRLGLMHKKGSLKSSMRVSKMFQRTDCGPAYTQPQFNSDIFPIVSTRPIAASKALNFSLKPLACCLVLVGVSFTLWFY